MLIDLLLDRRYSTRHTSKCAAALIIVDAEIFNVV